MQLLTPSGPGGGDGPPSTAGPTAAGPGSPGAPARHGGPGQGPRPELSTQHRTWRWIPAEDPLGSLQVPPAACRSLVPLLGCPSTPSAALRAGFPPCQGPWSATCSHREDEDVTQTHKAWRPRAGRHVDFLRFAKQYAAKWRDLKPGAILPTPAHRHLHKVPEHSSEIWLFTVIQTPRAPSGQRPPYCSPFSQSPLPPSCPPEHTHSTDSPRHLLGPFTVTPRSPLPAALVSTLKSAVSLMRTPLGCRPLPVARHALGLQAAGEFQTSIPPLIRNIHVAQPAWNNL